MFGLFLSNVSHWETYTYNANQLQVVNDAIIFNSKGFDDGNTSGNDYIYDANGNMIRDNNKGISITYNYLNLPRTITFDGNENIAILYDAAGVKLTKTSTDASGNSSTKDYVGGIEYANGTLEAIYHSEGRLTPKTGGGYLFEYTIKDHLGNSRVSFADLNGDGQISTDANNSEILQTNHYYPFGMQHEPASTVAGVENAYQYNGKELNSNFGLDWLDYGARWYDASIARWSVVDPLAEDNLPFSPYNYVENNPIIYIDPDGRDNILYVYYEEKDINSKEVKNYIKEINKQLKTLGLDVKAAAIDYIPNSSDLDESDSFVFTGTSEQVKNFLDANQEEGYGYQIGFTSEDVRKQEEVSANPALGDGNNLIMILTDNIDQSLDEANAKNKAAKGMKKDELMALDVAHGSGHNAGLKHTTKEVSYEDKRGRERTKKMPEGTFMDSTGYRERYGDTPKKKQKGFGKAAKTSTTAQKSQYHNKYSKPINQRLKPKKE